MLLPTLLPALGYGSLHKPARFSSVSESCCAAGWLCLRHLA